jgi:hypothetical protein
MWHYLTFVFDSRPLCVVTRPLAGFVIAGVLAGVIGMIGGFTHGAFHDNLHVAIEGGFRLASAGAAAAFVMGLWSGVDRLNWPFDEWVRSETLNSLLPLVEVNAEPHQLSPSPERSIRHTASRSAIVQQS